METILRITLEVRTPTVPDIVNACNAVRNAVAFDRSNQLQLSVVGVRVLAAQLIEPTVVPGIPEGPR